MAHIHLDQAGPVLPIKARPVQTDQGHAAEWHMGWALRARILADSAG